MAGSGTALAGSTGKVELTRPYEQGVTGSTWTVVGVHEEGDWVYVGLQQSKAAASSLVFWDGVKTLQLPGPSHAHGTIVTLACRLPS